MLRLLILRHGETEWNAAGRWQGWLDVDLAPLGEEQARRRAAALAGAGTRFALIVSSDLRRAARTAELIALRIGAPPIALDEAWRERHGGEFQGRDAAEIDTGWPGFRERWRAGLEDAPPGGESDAQVWQRVRASLERWATEVPDGPLLVVTHGGVFRVALERAGEPTRSVVPNVGGRWFTWHRGSLHAGETLEPLPDTDHTKPAIE
jgi:broad specificity phosphatase PhoE